MSKHLDIPHVPELSANMSADEIIDTLGCKGAHGEIDQQNWQELFPNRPECGFDIAHNGKAIFINFSASESNVRAVNTANNSTVCQDSCVEFFVMPEGDIRYWNFEFNCIGTVNASSRTERHNPTRLSDDELSQIIRLASLGNKPFDCLTGEQLWHLVIIIPLSLIGKTYNGTQIELRANFYKCADKSSMPHYLSWNAIDTTKPNFHCPEFFGTATLL